MKLRICLICFLFVHFSRGPSYYVISYNLYVACTEVVSCHYDCLVPEHVPLGAILKNSANNTRTRRREHTGHTILKNGMDPLFQIGFIPTRPTFHSSNL
uniref:Putative secreted protein n=1 Tax=Ixodes scapularis TaxID=6945 RepID=A0A4D5RBI0_IXOSC